MPEIKNTFVKGRMNKDLDERLVPNGEYRDAMNVQVSISEGSDVGTIQNLLGNIQMGNLGGIPFGNRSCVGSIADEKNDALYWFVASEEEWNPIYTVNTNLVSDVTLFPTQINADYIWQYTTVGGEVPVCVDIMDMACGLTHSGTFGGPYNGSSFFTSPQVISNILIGMELTGIVELTQTNSQDTTYTVINTYNFTNTFVSSIDKVTNSFQLNIIPPILDILASGLQYGVNVDTIAFIFSTGQEYLELNANSLITGVNIVDDMLFWTDGITEPKKINIPRSIAGTPSAFEHTRLINEKRGIELIDNIHLTKKHITVIKESPHNPPLLDLQTDLTDFVGTTFWTDQPACSALYANASGATLNAIPWAKTGVVRVTTNPYPSSPDNDDIQAINGNPVYDFSTLQIGDIVSMWVREDISGNDTFHLNWGNGANLLNKKVVLKEFNEDNTNAPPIPITDYRIKGVITGMSTHDDPSTGTVTFANMSTCNMISEPGVSKILVQIEVVSISGYPPVPDDDESERKYALDLFDEQENLYEFKFPRFGTRYRYEDGEYSTFSPFTEVAFVPGSFDYHPKKGYNLGMTNRLKSVIVKNFRPDDIPLDVVSIDILYKEEGSTAVYVIDTLRADEEKHIPTFPTNITGTNPQPISGWGSGPWNHFQTNHYEITEETIKAAVPSNQLIRHWDNVPRIAKAQEITGNRIVYGNYTQGFDIKGRETADGTRREYYPQFNSSLISFTTDYSTNAVRSIKSLREYQIGVVFIDEYGRETPVLSNKSGSFKIEKQLSVAANRLKVKFDAPPPFPTERWPLKYFKFFIKETSGEYYNLAMDRWYDAEDGNVWLSFPSSDRNKIDIDTFLILKKGADSNNAIIDEAKYKVLAIEDNAPDFVKTTKSRIDTKTHVTTGTSVFDQGISGIPLPGSSSFTMNYEPFIASTSSELHKWDSIKDGDLHVDFTKNGTNATSKRYKIAKITNDSIDQSIAAMTASRYHVQIEGIFGNDILFITNDPSGNNVTALENLSKINIYKHKVENKAQFDGRFFVKIFIDDIFSREIQGTFDEEEDIEYFVTSSRELFYMQKQEIHQSMHRISRTGHGNETDQHSGNGNAYDNNFGRYACYFRNYDDVDKNYKFNNDDWAVEWQKYTGSAEDTSSAVSTTTNGIPQPNSENMPISSVTVNRASSYLNGKPADDNPEQVWYITARHSKGNRDFSINNDFWWGNDPASSVNAGISNNSHDAVPFKYYSNSQFMQIAMGGIYHHSSINGSGNEQDIDTSSGVNPSIDKFYAIGEPGGNPNYDDGTTIDLVNNITNPGVKFRWREDPYGTIYTNSGQVKHKNLLSYEIFVKEWGGDVGVAGDNYGGSAQNFYPGGSGAGPFWNNKEQTTNGGQLAPNFSKHWKIKSQPNMSYNWSPIGDSSINSGNSFGSLGAIPQGYKIPLTTVNDNDPVSLNTINDLDLHYIRVTSPVGTDTTFGDIKISPGMLLTHYVNTSDAEVSLVGGPILWGDGNYGAAEKPPLLVREVEIINENETHIYLQGYMDPINAGLIGIATPTANDNALNGHAIPSAGTNEIKPGGTVTFRQPAMNGYSEFSANRLSIHFGKTHGNVSTPDTGLLGAVSYTLEFLQEVDQEASMPENPAIFETEPQDSPDLDIYYEASGFMPLQLTEDTMSMMIPTVMGIYNTHGSIQNSILTYGGVDYEIADVNGFDTANQTNYHLLTFPGLPAIPAGDIRITRPDGSWFTAQIDDAWNSLGNLIDPMDRLILSPNIYQKDFGLNWYNCYSFGNGVESNRIRDNFNLPYIYNGVKASTTLEQYKQEDRKYGLIYSGIYNSISGTNNLNQFIAGEKITKDINPIYGSIQKLHSRDSDLVTLCEDKILRILANKDAVYNADGNPQLTANINVLGQTIPFVGEYGISQNPESFASESYRAYFTDKQRGVVLRLSKDGLTPISDHGMKDWFRDHLKLSTQLIGSYDDRQEEYNISIKDYGRVVSFKENVKGWVSFKSFAQMENGISMANNYYTFEYGYLYQHHHPASPRNTFYGHQLPSTVTVLLNQDPSVVKRFQTISYEGSQAKVTRIDGDGQYYNLNNVRGWYLNTIITDLQEGGMIEFIEKEGKWFNYIKGNCSDTPDSNEFSYQGLVGNINPADIIIDWDAFLEEVETTGIQTIT